MLQRPLQRCCGAPSTPHLQAPSYVGTAVTLHDPQHFLPGQKGAGDNASSDDNLAATTRRERRNKQRFSASARVREPSPYKPPQRPFTRIPVNIVANPISSPSYFLLANGHPDDDFLLPFSLEASSCVRRRQSGINRCLKLWPPAQRTFAKTISDHSQ